MDSALSNLSKYLEPAALIDSDHPAIQAKASELTAGLTEDAAKAVRLFYFVRDSIRYKIYVSKSRAEYFVASRTLANGEGYCVMKAALLAALGRAAGIPCALGFARLRNHLMPPKVRQWLGTDVLPFHGYTEFYLDGKWVKANAAFDLKMCERLNIVPVNFDATADAYFPAYNYEGQRHMEYLSHLGTGYADVPVELVWKTLTDEFGPDILEPPQKS